MKICKSCIHKGVCKDFGVDIYKVDLCYNYTTAAEVEEVKHGKWIFKEQTKLIATDKVAIIEGYHNVNNRNLEKAVMVLKKRIKVKKPFCSVCGDYGDDIGDATPYCPNCGAKMDGKEVGENEQIHRRRFTFKRYRGKRLVLR